MMIDILYIAAPSIAVVSVVSCSNAPPSNPTRIQSLSREVGDLRIKMPLTEVELARALGLSNQDYQKGGIRGFSERWDLEGGFHLILYREEAFPILKMPAVDKRRAKYNRVELFKGWDLIASSKRGDLF